MCHKKIFRLPVIAFVLVVMLALLFTGFTFAPVKADDGLSAPTLSSPANNAVLSVVTEHPTVYLQWNAVSGATYYTVQVSKLADFSELVFSATGLTNYWLSPQLELGTVYYWHVKAGNNDGVSAWSATYNFKFIPKEPILVSPTNCNCCLRPGMINLQWYSYFPNESEVQLSCSYSFINPLFSVTVNPSSYSSGRYYYQFSSYLGIGTYYWRARVISGNGTYSYWTTPQYFRLNSPPAVAPSIITPANGGLVTSTSVLLKWDSVYNATSYQIDLVNEDTGVPSSIGTGKTYYRFEGTNNTHYKFRVRAGNCVGFGPWSNWSEFYILLPPATPQQIYPRINQTFTRTNQVKLIWTQVPTTDYYQVRVTDLTLGVVKQFVVSGNELVFKGEFNHSYLWKVRAANRAGSSSWTSSYFEIVDRTPPMILVDYPSVTNKSLVKIVGTIVDRESGVKAAWFSGKHLELANGKFAVAVNLSPGRNKFVIKAVDKAGNWSEKRIISVFYDDVPPTLEIMSPRSSSIYTNAVKVIEDIKIVGRVSDNYKVKQLLINSDPVKFDSNGNFGYQTRLHYGANVVHITATDYAGNRTSRELLISKVPAEKKIIFKIGNPNMVVYTPNEEGKLVPKLVPIDPGRGTVPVIVHNRTFIPIRAFVQEIGGKVGWNPIQRKVKIVLPNRSIVIELWIEKSKARITNSSGSKWVQIEPGNPSVKPFIKNGRSYFPLRFIAENFGLSSQNITWNALTETVTIFWPVYPSSP